MNVGDPEKDGDETQGGEERVSEREGDDGRPGDEPGGGVAGRNVEAVAVGKFEPEAHEAHEGEKTDAEHDVECRKNAFE
jgi:hypothetical protein